MDLSHCKLVIIDYCTCNKIQQQKNRNTEP